MTKMGRPRTMRDPRTLTIRMERALKDAIEAEAERQGRTVTALVLDALGRAFPGEAARPAERRRRRA